MKIRSNFVSNSSSSSFIIAGDNIICILNKFITDNEVVKWDEYSEFNPYCTYGDVNCEILHQCKNSTDEDIKNVILGNVEQTCEYYIIEQYYKMFMTDRHSNVYIINSFNQWHSEDKYYSLYIKGTEFDIPCQLKKEIKKEMKNYKKKNPNATEWDFRFIEKYFSEYRNKIEAIVDDILESFKSKYKEIYAVSFGDNHGNCCGEMGWFVEANYLGRKAINGRLNTKWKIYRLNEH